MTQTPEECGHVIPPVRLLSFEEPRRKGRKERREQNIEKNEKEVAIGS